MCACGAGPGLARLIPCLHFLLLLALLLSATAAADPAVVMSAGVDAYAEALRGFNGTLRYNIVGAAENGQVAAVLDRAPPRG